MSGRNDLGRFVWHDLMTTDSGAVIPFYTGLFPEWKLHSAALPDGQSYSVIHVGERAIGCVIPLERALGVPSHWVGYVAVEDCDATVARMEERGGKVLVPAMSAPGVGRFALVRDPQGAFLKPIQLEKPYPLPATSWPGEVCWHELMTRDVEKARTFYGEVFGWQTHLHPMATGGTYTVFRLAGQDVAGGMALPGGKDGPPCWVYYLAAEDVDARSRRVVELGGQVHVGPRDIPGIGRFSMVSDPSGAVFALFHFTQA